LVAFLDFELFAFFDVTVVVVVVLGAAVVVVSVVVVAIGCVVRVGCAYW
jgi:hypothetical protein